VTVDFAVALAAQSSFFTVNPGQLGAHLALPMLAHELSKEVKLADGKRGIITQNGA
jgi:hypothetical protein